MRWDKRITLNLHQSFYHTQRSFSMGCTGEKEGRLCLPGKEVIHDRSPDGPVSAYFGGVQKTAVFSTLLGTAVHAACPPAGQGSISQGSGTAFLPGFDRSTSGGIAGNCAPERDGPRSCSDRLPGSGGDLPSPSGSVGRAAERSTWSPERVASRSAWKAAGSQASGKQAPLCKISDIF